MDHPQVQALEIPKHREPKSLTAATLRGHSLMESNHKWVTVSSHSGSESPKNGTRPVTKISLVPPVRLWGSDLTQILERRQDALCCLISEAQKEPGGVTGVCWGRFNSVQTSAARVGKQEHNKKHLLWFQHQTLLLKYSEVLQKYFRIEADDRSEKRLKSLQQSF